MENSQDSQSLMPSGLGQVAAAANQSGLTAMAGQAAMSQVDNMTNGMRNEDQVQMFYHLLAAHPNQVALFFLSYPNFMAEFANLIGLIVRKEMYALFNSGAIGTAEERGGPLPSHPRASDRLRFNHSRKHRHAGLQGCSNTGDANGSVSSGHACHADDGWPPAKHDAATDAAADVPATNDATATDDATTAQWHGCGSRWLRLFAHPWHLGLPPAQNQMQGGMMPQQPGMVPQQPGMNGF